MKSSKELKELRGDKISELEAIKDIATAEERDLNEADRSFTETMIRTACRPYFTNVKQSEG